MYSIKHYFISISSPSSANSSSSANSTMSCSTPNSPAAVASKLIVENMTQVISSVKKQQHQRRRAKRLRQRDATSSNDEPPEINDISTILSSSLRFVSPNASATTADLKTDDAAAAAAAAAAEPLQQEQNVVDAAAVAPTNADRVEEQSKHSGAPTKRTPRGRQRKSTRRSNTKENLATNTTTTPTTSNSCASDSQLAADSTAASASATPTTTGPAAVATPKKNAFEMLMKARNKSIGTNSPGPDCGNSSSISGTPTTTTTTTSGDPDEVAVAASGSSVPSTKTKRKLMLESWAERKGANKRKLLEDEAGEYVNRQMTKRAKRLKRLLANGSKPSASGEEDEPDAAAQDANEVQSPNASYLKFTFNKLTKNKEKKKSNPLRVFDSDDENENANPQPSDDAVAADKTANASVSVADVDPKDTAPKSNTPHSTKPLTPLAVQSPCDAKPTIRTALRSPAPTTKSPRNAALVARRKSIYTPTRTPTTSAPKQAAADTAVEMCLSSPIKKRDSLLGYFNKVAKSPVHDEKTESEAAVIDLDETSNESPLPSVPVAQRRRVGRSRKSTASTPSTRSSTLASDRECTSPLLLAVDAAAAEPETAGTPTTHETPATSSKANARSRPKRGCRDKTVSYKPPPDDESSASSALERSPAKEAAQKSVRRARRLLSAAGGAVSPRPSAASPSDPNRRLAPIFVKAPARPTIDPETARARQEFLRSGIPEKMRLDIERQRAFVESYAYELDVFPLVSHVTQLSPVADDETVGARPRLRYRLDDAEPLSSDAVPATFRLGKYRVKPAKSAVVATAAARLDLSRPKDLVKQLKEMDGGKFLYFRCYKHLRRMYQQHETVSETHRPTSALSSEPEASNDSVIEIVDSAAAVTASNSNGTLMFTEKYKPTNSDEIIVNSLPVLQLKKFLATWQENYAQRVNGRQRRTASASATDDDDDFESSGSSSGTSSALSKAVCLIGPTGSGKTNAVYALANELHFNVLEINAGCKRTGKKMLQELLEATQSHQVKSGGGGVIGPDRMFRSASQSQTPPIIPISSEESSSGSASASTASPKLSLILIEDADIVFDQDNGFVEAIFQLIASSKRPVILVANQASCAHLARFDGSNVIQFQAANDVHAGKWLSLLSVAEHRFVSHVDCRQLYRRNMRNMRRTVLDLQFFLQSGGDRERSTGGVWGRHYAHQRLVETFAPIDRRFVGRIDFDGLHQQSIGAGRSNSLEETLAFCEAMSSAHRLQTLGHRQRTRLYDDDDDLTWNMIDDVTSVLTETAMLQRQTQAVDDETHNVNPKKRLLSDGFAAMGLAHSTAHRRALHLDVEPCLRAICRSEKARTQTERAHRRFYHYLRNAVVGSSFSSADTFDGHCTILWDDDAPTPPPPTTTTTENGRGRDKQT